jgi:riboflavin kinase/FMN adenylyltransferase
MPRSPAPDRPLPASCTEVSIKPWIVFPGDRSPSLSPCAVAVGNFDGVHRGHAGIVRRLRAAAAEAGVPAVVLTFDPHPAAFVRPGATPPPLTTAERRADLLLALGVDAVVVQPIDAGFVTIEAERFYGEVLRGRLRASALVEGADFRFGAGRRGDVSLLAHLCAADGVRLEIVPPVVVGDTAVSSSRIRSLVAAGAVREAAALMTAPYRLTGTVIEGARRGGALGFPTANLDAIATLLPAHGVYAGRATVAAEGSHHPAAIHVGPTVSFGGTAVAVEVHLIGFRGDLYGGTLHVDFLERLRDTRRFASAGELQEQLAADVARAAEITRDDGHRERTS